MNHNKMSHKERIMAALGKLETDYSPCIVNYHNLSKVVRGNRKVNFPWGENASVQEQIRYSVDELGISQIVDFSIPIRRMHKDVKWKTWKENNLLYKQYETPAGSVRAVVEFDRYWTHGDDIPLSTDWTANFKEPWIENEQDLECIKYLFIPWEPDHTEYMNLKESYKKTKDFAEQYGLPIAAYAGGGLTIGLQMFLPEKLCFKTLENPELVHGFLEMEHKCNLRTIEIAGDLGIDIIKRNGFYESSDFYSPQMLEDFLGRRLTEEINKTHQYDMKMIYTLHTGIMPMLDYLNHLDIDCIFGIDIAFPGVSLEKIKEKLFHNKALFTGPSSTHHLWNPDPDVTRKSVRTIYETLGKTGVILGPCVSMHNIMPWGNLLAMIDEWKKLR
ncbi:MAG TPA: hypothetical protein DDZ89_03305 [Clostridiales bacterium]|nr:hypothetical protein [Clostridiales bacterium]